MTGQLEKKHLVNKNTEIQCPDQGNKGYSIHFEEKKAQNQTMWREEEEDLCWVPALYPGPQIMGG